MSSPTVVISSNTPAITSAPTPISTERTQSTSATSRETPSRRSGQLHVSDPKSSDNHTSLSEAGTSTSNSQQGSVSLGVSMPLSTPTYYELSCDDSSPALSPIQQEKTSVPTSMLHEVFPSLESEQASLLLELYNNSVYDVTEALLDGITMNASMVLRKFQMVRQTGGVQHIEVRLDHVVEDGLRSLYKGSFDVSAKVEVEIVGSLTTDLGGPRRQFFNHFLRQMPNKLNLVEENDGVVFFTCNTESLLGGHYARLGQVIVHSVLNEGPAFPYLPKAVYYYMISGIDEAVSHLSREELPSEAKYVVEQVMLLNYPTRMHKELVVL